MSGTTPRTEPNPFLGLGDPHSGENVSSGAVTDRQRTGNSTISSSHTALPVSSSRRPSSNDENSMAQASSGWVTASLVTHSQNISPVYISTPVRDASGSVNTPSHDGLRLGPNESPIDHDNNLITSDDLIDNSNETPSSMADARVGPAPKFNHEALQQSLHGEQLRAVQTLMAHQEFMRKKLCARGSYMRRARIQVQELRAHAESLSGHLEWSSRIPFKSYQTATP